MVKNKQRLESKGEGPSEKEWKRKTPYDFTGCLAHMDLTFRPVETMKYCE